MDLNELKNKLKKYSNSNIVITDHAKDQAIVRDIELEDVIGNITNPVRLVYAEKQNAKKVNEEKYDCYFAYSKELCHRYILTINGKLLIVTIIKINRDWQKIIERK